MIRNKNIRTVCGAIFKPILWNVNETSTLVRVFIHIPIEIRVVLLRWIFSFIYPFSVVTWPQDFFSNQVIHGMIWHQHCPVITITSHERHNVINYLHLDYCFDILWSWQQRKRQIFALLSRREESTGNQWLPWKGAGNAERLSMA